MRNKKSVLMTLNPNFGYFSGVGFGIAGNGGCYTMAGASAHPSIDLRQIKKVQNRL